MAYKFKTNLANRSNYGKARALSDIKFIVVHYTGNDGDTDENNGNYFKRNIVKASAHYFVDDDSITQSVPDDYVAYSVGGSRYSNYKTTGGASMYGKATNANTLNIELCDDVRNGSVYPSAGVIANAIDLVKTKMAQYGIPASNVIRHFDVTGKACPAYWSGTAEKNALWLTEFKNKLGGTTPQKVATQNAAYYPRYTGNSTSIATALNAIGVDNSYQYRKKIAVANNIVGYAGTAAQNTRLLNLLKAGQLKKA